MALLCASASVIEGLMNSQMNNFAESANFLHQSVHGYRDGYSTVTALLEIQHRMVKTVECGELSSLCLLDVSSGFDIYLLRKLELLGYDNNSI